VLPEIKGTWPEFYVEADFGQHHGIVLESIKRGEDDEAEGKTSIILRMYESAGGKARGQLNM